MLSKTHVFGGLTLLVAADVIAGGVSANIPTAYFGTAACILGALTPDLDKPGSIIYSRIPLGSIIGKVIHPVFIGGHRHLSHSLLGLVIYYFLASFLLSKIPTYLGLNVHLLLMAYMIGIISHLILDSMTTEGIPLLFPINCKFGIPPISALRVTTGSVVEHFIVFPSLLIIMALLYFHYYYIFIR